MTTRRDFLKVALSATGTLALGFVLPACHGAGAVMADHADKTGELVPNAWLKITPDDRIVFMLDRVEMGQGTMTSHTVLLAEELEVDPRKMHIQLADASRAYDNPDPEVGFQITGGSTSVKGSYLPLRKAGASARELLRAAAASTWGVPISECTADDGAIKHTSGKRATYGSLTKAAAHLPIPSEPPLKQPSQFRWIGKSLRRFDGKMKVDGSGIYGIDVKLPGLLTAVILRPPTIGGSLKSFRADKAKSEGVIDVFAIPSGVAVVATSTWRARAAAEKVEVEWEPGPLAKLDTEGIRAAYAAKAKQEGAVVRSSGDWKGNLDKGAARLTATYELPYIAHATMEPMNCTAHVEDDKCTVWAPTQAPSLARIEAQKITSLPMEAITVHTTLLGGGFGRRSFCDFVADAVHTSRKLKKPVKVVWSREDDMRNDFYRPMTLNTLDGAVNSNGEITAWFHRIVGPSIVKRLAPDWGPGLMPSGMPRSLTLMMTRTVASLYGNDLAGTDPTSIQGIDKGDFPYALSALRVEHVPYESGIAVGPWRSVGYSENCFIVESFLDELAHAAKKDPLEMRRSLLKEKPKLRAVLDLAAEKAGWGKPLPAGVARGVALVEAFTTHCAQVVEASIEGGKIRVHRVVCAIDCGIVVNPDLVAAQLESGIAYGLSAALKQEITFEAGRVKQGNFHQFELLRMHEMPKVEVHIVPSNDEPRGVGEPGVPPIAPAVANAIFALTGKRLRRLPLQRALDESTGGKG